MQVLLGNASAAQEVTDDDGAKRLVPVPDAGERVLTINIPDDVSLGEAFVSITDPRGVWRAHSTEGATPTWVSSENEGLEFILSQHFGCDRGVPANVEATHYTEAGPPGVGPDGPVNKDGALKASARRAQEDSE
jgi:hypothetical protein